MACLTAINLIQQHATVDEYYKKVNGANGYYSFRIIMAQERCANESFSKGAFAASPMYATVEEREIAIEHCKTIAPRAFLAEMDLSR
jgi:hypothetical protein